MQQHVLQVIREVASLSNRYNYLVIYGSTNARFADEPKAKGASYEFRAYPTPSSSRAGIPKGGVTEGIVRRRSLSDVPASFVGYGPRSGSTFARRW